MWKNNVLLFNGVVEIHHAGLIWKTEQYDQIQISVMSYLHFEGFLEKVDLENPGDCGDMFDVEDIQIFDLTGKRVTREQLI
jgi:hypothetical protein